MFKKIVITIALVSLAFAVTGCPFFTSAAHARGHHRNTNKGWENIHRFTDRHFWNYDWDDPNDN